MNPTDAELKLTIAKLIELGYASDKGLTTKIVRQSGNFKLSVDQNGQVTLSGSAGALTYSGNPALQTIGTKFKRVSVAFSNGEGGIVNYKASFSLAVFSLSVSGSFDIEELITSCSGLLCKAANLLRQRNSAQEQELQRIMGGN